MSTADHAPGAHDHDDGAHDDFDPEPTHSLAAGEPQTPMWIPAVGLALFVAAAVIFLLAVRDDASDTSGAPVAVAPAAEVRAPELPAPAAVRPAAAADPDASARPARPKLTREQMDELRRKIKAPPPRPAAPDHDDHAGHDHPH